MPCKRTAATSIRAILLLGTFVATPALAATADLSVVITGPYTKTTDTAPKTINFGGAAIYKVTISNAGPNHAEGVKLNATLSPELTGAATTNCTPDSDTSAFPCTIDTAAGAGILIDGGSVEVVITTSVGMSDTCRTTLAATVVTVSSTSTDSSTANNTAQVTNNYGTPSALETTVTGPATASVGDTITYTISVKNVSPCAATDVGWEADAYEGVINPMLTFVSDSVGSANDCYNDGCFNSFAPTIAPNATATVDVKYKVGALPADIYAKTLTVPQTFAVATGAADGGNVDISGYDPNGANKGAYTVAVNTNKEGGCNSTGGAGGLLGLALMGLAAWRRRKA